MDHFTLYIYFLTVGINAEVSDDHHELLDLYQKKMKAILETSMESRTKISRLNSMRSATSIRFTDNFMFTLTDGRDLHCFCQCFYYLAVCFLLLSNCRNSTVCTRNIYGSLLCPNKNKTQSCFFGSVTPGMRNTRISIIFA